MEYILLLIVFIGSILSLWGDTTNEGRLTKKGYVAAIIVTCSLLAAVFLTHENQKNSKTVKTQLEKAAKQRDIALADLAQANQILEGLKRSAKKEVIFNEKSDKFTGKAKGYIQTIITGYCFKKRGANCNKIPKSLFLMSMIVWEYIDDGTHPYNAIRKAFDQHIEYSKSSPGISSATVGKVESELKPVWREIVAYGEQETKDYVTWVVHEYCADKKC